MGKLLLWTGLLCFIAACGRTARPLESTADVALLNQEGKDAPAREPTTGLAPFGILLISEQPFNYCSASHFPGHQVITSAHCVRDKEPGHYRVMFYDKDGTKRISAVEKFIYVGDPQKDDLAVLGISASTSAQWDEATGEYLSAPEKNLARPFQATVWAFDSVAKHPEIPKRREKNAVIFNPRHCSATWKQPSYRGLTYFQDDPLGTPDCAGSLRVFYDKCDAPTTPGNSGSLVTVSNEFFRKVGVHQMTIGPTDRQLATYPFISYRSTQGKVEYYESETLLTFGLYSAGISFSGFFSTGRDFR